VQKAIKGKTVRKRAVNTPVKDGLATTLTSGKLAPAIVVIVVVVAIATAAVVVVITIIVIVIGYTGDQTPAVAHHFTATTKNALCTSYKLRWGVTIYMKLP
jgi:hypothetical protein